VAKRYEDRETRAGLKVKKVEFKTVKDLCNWYMTLPTTQDQKSYERKVSASAHILEHLGNKAVNDVEGDTQERYREKRKAEKAAAGTVDYEIQLLSAMYHLALKRKKLDPNMMPGEFIRKNETNPRRIITDEEYEKILEYAAPDFRDVLVCAYESAMRSSEITKFTASQVHLDMRHISGTLVSFIDLGIFDTKTGARRTVPVSAALKEVLKRRLEGLEPNDRVFGKYSVTSISHRMESCCKKANIPYGDKLLNEKGEREGVVFHCLRHTRTTKWVEMGYSDEIIRCATGHKTLEAYQRYVKLDPAVVMRLVETDNFGRKSAESLETRAFE
jgi:integrase